MFFQGADQRVPLHHPARLLLRVLRLRRGEHPRRDRALLLRHQRALVFALPAGASRPTELGQKSKISHSSVPVRLRTHLQRLDDNVLLHAAGTAEHVHRQRVLVLVAASAVFRHRDLRF